MPFSQSEIVANFVAVEDSLDCTNGASDIALEHIHTSTWKRANEMSCGGSAVYREHDGPAYASAGGILSARNKASFDRAAHKASGVASLYGLLDANCPRDVDEAGALRARRHWEKGDAAKEGVQSLGANVLLRKAEHVREKAAAMVSGGNEKLPTQTVGTE